MKHKMNDATFIALMVVNMLSVTLMYLCLTDVRISDDARWLTAGIGAISFLMTWALVWVDKKSED
jgi:hypothetical protein